MTTHGHKRQAQTNPPVVQGHVALRRPHVLNHFSFSQSYDDEKTADIGVASFKIVWKVNRFGAILQSHSIQQSPNDVQTPDLAQVESLFLDILTP